MNGSSPNHFRSSVLFGALFLIAAGSIQAQSAADTIAFIIKNKKNDIQLCDDLYNLGNYYRGIGESENAYLVANQCKSIAENIHYDKGVYNAYSITGNVNVSEAKYEKALAVSREWYQLAFKKHNEPEMNRANYLLVLVLYRQGENDTAVAISRRILEVPQLTYDSVTLPKFNTLIAAVALRKGDFTTANTHYLEALRIAELTHNEQLQTVCLSNLSMLNEELNNFREALKYQEKALTLALKHNEILNVGLIYENRGITYQAMAIPDSALYFYNKALPIFKQLQSDENIAIIYDNMGEVLANLGQLDSAMYYMQLTKKQFILIGSKDSPKIANNRMRIGQTWIKMAEAKNNKSYLKNALAEVLVSKGIGENEKIQNVKMNSYWTLAEIYHKMGNIPNAYEYLLKYNNISDSIRSISLTEQIAEMQTIYETQKKEVEISRLNTEKSLDAEKIARQKTLNYSLSAIAALLLISGFLIFRNVQNKRTTEKQFAILEKQNAIESMRNKIASDVHDEMGANLTRLGLNAQQLLQSPVIPEQEKQLAEKIALQSKDIITGMREIIWTSNPANDNLKSMLGFMRQYIDRFFDGTNIRPVVNFPHDVGEVALHPEVRRNLFFILKESLNNAIKYSGSDRIDIDFQNESENFNLKIKDYGKGIDDQNKDAFSYGLRNMKMRAEYIQSIFQLITAPGQGVQISIEGKLY